MLLGDNINNISAFINNYFSGAKFANYIRISAATPLPLPRQTTTSFLLKGKSLIFFWQLSLCPTVCPCQFMIDTYLYNSWEYFMNLE